MSDNYDEILNRTWEEVPELQLLKTGGWLVKGRSVALIRPKDEGKSLKVLFGFKAEQPVSVAQDLLDEMGDYDFTANDLNYTMYVETAADWDKVRKFLDIFGVEVDKKKPIIDSATGKLSFSKDFQGREAIAEISERSYDNDAGQTIWQNQLSKFQKADA